MSDDLECAICYQRIDEYDWYVWVRREADSPLHVRVAHHTCPPMGDED